MYISETKIAGEPKMFKLEERYPFFLCMAEFYFKRPEAHVNFDKFVTISLCRNLDPQTYTDLK